MRVRPVLAGSWRPAAGLLALSLALLVLNRVLVHPQSIDLWVYRSEGLAVRHDLPLYVDLHAPQHLQATYPPFAAVVFEALTLVPAHGLATLALLANLALLLVAVDRSFTLAGVTPRHRLTAVLIATAPVVWFEPVFTTLNNGQINLLLLVLVLVDLTRRPGSRWCGVGIGLAAGIKLTPAIFIGYLLITRRFRAAATATATLAVTLAVSALVIPSATRHYWTSMVFETKRVGRLEDVSNQSLYGALARVTRTTTELPLESVVALLVAVGGLACAAWAWRRLGEAFGVLATAVTGLLVAPISWTHHFVWVVPAAVVLWYRSRAWAAATAAVFFSYALFFLPHSRIGDELHYNPVQILLAALYALYGLALLLQIAVWARAAKPAAAPAVVQRPRVLTGR